MCLQKREDMHMLLLHAIKRKMACISQLGFSWDNVFLRVAVLLFVMIGGAVHYILLFATCLHFLSTSPSQFRVPKKKQEVVHTEPRCEVRAERCGWAPCWGVFLTELELTDGKAKEAATPRMTRTEDEVVQGRESPMLKPEGLRMFRSRTMPLSYWG